MAKKSKAFSGVDDLMTGAIEAAQNKFGRSEAYLAADHGENIFGIPMPPLAMQYLFRVNIWPLQRLTILAGEKGSHKSSFFFELCRWTLGCGGAAFLIETEEKTNAEFLSSVVGPAAASRVSFMPANTTEEWMDKLTWTISFIQKNYTKETCPPVLIGVDSSNGVITNESKEHIQEEGHPKARTYDTLAKLLTQYCRGVPGMLRGWPINITWVAHLKPMMESQGASETAAGRFVRSRMTKAGGHGQDFNNTMELWFKKLQANINKTDPFDGARVVMTVNKNSMGPDVEKGKPRHVESRFLWQETEEDGQKSWWDWDTSTALLLERFNGPDLKEVLPFSVTGRSFSGEVTGGDKLNPMEFGRLINNDPTLLAKLSEWFHIRQHNLACEEE